MIYFHAAFAIALFFWLTDIAYGYPNTIRHGYNGGCQSCHVSPTGGGALTGYGRMVSEELSTWAVEGAGNLLGATATPERVMVGGDTRYLRLVTPRGSKTFLMQNDWELAVRMSPEMTVAVAAGLYNESDELESRRNYLLWQPAESVHVRVGRFMPGFGIMVADHTTVTKAALGFNQGRESYNFELGLHHEYGELLLTSAVPYGTQVTLQNDPAYHLDAKLYSYLARAAVYLYGQAQLGLNYRLTVLPEQAYEHTAGAFALWGDDSLYAMAEYDQLFLPDGTYNYVGFTELGWELYRGIHLQASYEYADGNIPGVALNLFPFPHIELLARVKYVGGAAVPVFMFHSHW